MDLRAPPSTQGAASRGGTLVALVLQIVTLGALAALIVILIPSDTHPPSAEAESLREIASKLKAAGALDEAAAVYERYLSITGDTPQTRAKVAYALGSLYMERGRYEKAIRWLYQAETLGAGDLDREIGTRIVHCLERLGRVHAARAALAARVEMDEDGEVHRAKDDAVVARIGAHDIFASDLQKALDDLPPELAKHFADPTQREAFLRKYVADELISRKAQKLEYDQDPDVRRQLESVFKQLIVSVFVEKEILGKIEMSEPDLKNYYQANRERYDQKESARLRMIKVASADKAQSLKKQLDSKSTSFAQLAREHSLDMASRARGGELNDWVARGAAFLDEGDAKTTSEAIFAAGKGAIVGPLSAGKHVYLFEVLDKRPAKARSFEEVRRRVEQDYRLMKTQAAYQDLITQELSAENVELHPEKLSSLR